MEDYRFGSNLGRNGKSKNIFESLRYAFRGIVAAIFYEVNFRWQLTVLGIVIAASWWLQLSLSKISIIILAAMAVLTCELFNSALEVLADACHPDYDEKIKRAKDMGAGAVLIVSIAALIIGVVILGPELLALV
jgi:diacylglycerol kinase